MKIGLGICGIHVNSSIADELILVKMSIFIRSRVNSFRLAFTILIHDLDVIFGVKASRYSHL